MRCSSWAPVQGRKWDSPIQLFTYTLPPSARHLSLPCPQATVQLSTSHLRGMLLLWTYYSNLVKSSISQNNCVAWASYHPTILQIPLWCARAALQGPDFSENAEQRVQGPCLKVDELTFHKSVLGKTTRPCYLRSSNKITILWKPW